MRKEIPVETKVARRIGVKRWQIWFGLWGGATAWLIHLLLVYALAEFGCVGGLADIFILHITLVAWLLIAATLITIVLAALALVIARRNERQLREELPVASGEDHPRVFAAKAGWMSSAAFIVVILMQAVPIFFFLREC